ncbi:MAG: cysteine dioxygenase family protein, partial [Bdellovibrionales bacterium]|nr:cysteine dioxygenase family protein [Bdellovibrionales bacterium]
MTQPALCETFELSRSLSSAPKLTALVEFLDASGAELDLGRTVELLKNLEITRSDVAPLLRFSERAYARNVVKHTDQYDVFLICWRPGQASTIHDHRGSVCAFKIVSGHATEIVFEPTVGGYVRPMTERLYSEGEICSAQDDETVHQVINRTTANEDLVTLHIYAPPLKMNVFELDPAFDHD